MPIRVPSRVPIRVQSRVPIRVQSRKQIRVQSRRKTREHKMEQRIWEWGGERWRGREDGGGERV